MVLTKRRETNLETQLLEVRHMSTPKLFYLGLPKFCFEVDVFECMTSPSYAYKGVIMYHALANNALPPWCIAINPNAT